MTPYGPCKMSPYRSPVSIPQSRPKVSWWHRNIAHSLGWYYGTVETWWDGDTLMIGFRCSTCGRLGHVHERGDGLMG